MHCNSLCIAVLAWLHAILRWLLDISTRHSSEITAKPGAAYKGSTPNPPKAVAVVWAEDTVDYSAVKQLVDILTWNDHESLEAFLVYDPSGVLKSRSAHFQSELPQTIVQVGWQTRPLGRAITCQACRAAVDCASPAVSDASPSTWPSAPDASASGTAAPRTSEGPCSAPLLQADPSSNCRKPLSAIAPCCNGCAAAGAPSSTAAVGCNPPASRCARLSGDGQTKPTESKEAQSLIPSSAASCGCRRPHGSQHCTQHETGCDSCGPLNPVAATPSTCGTRRPGPEAGCEPSPGCSPADIASLQSTDTSGVSPGGIGSSIGLQPCSRCTQSKTADAEPIDAAAELDCSCKAPSHTESQQQQPDRKEDGRADPRVACNSCGSRPACTDPCPGGPAAHVATAALRPRAGVDGRLRVHLLSAEDGYAPVLGVARTGGVCSRCGSSGPLKSGPYREGLSRLRNQMAELAGPAVLMQPELVLVVGPVLTLAGFPPLQVAAAEILHLGPSRGLSRARVEAALAKFLRTEQRFGS